MIDVVEEGSGFGARLVHSVNRCVMPLIALHRIDIIFPATCIQDIPYVQYRGLDKSDTVNRSRSQAGGPPTPED